MCSKLVRYEFRFSSEAGTQNQCPVCFAARDSGRRSNSERRGDDAQRVRNLPMLGHKFNMKGISTKMNSLITDLKDSIEATKRYEYSLERRMQPLTGLKVLCSLVGHVRWIWLNCTFNGKASICKNRWEL
jgi:hypothetical protein